MGTRTEVTCEACRKTVPWKEGMWWQKATICSIVDDGYIDGTYDVLLCPECVEEYRKMMDNFLKGT